MAQVPTGTTFSVATAFGSAKTVSAVTNAAEAVCTSTAHGLANGDIVEVTSGWGRLNKRYARLKSVTTNDFVLEGIDTTNTSYFPAGSGTGSVRKVNTFSTIGQITGASSSGGDPKTVTYKYLDSDVEYNINDGFSATSYQLDLDADAIGSAGYTALKSLTEVQSDTCLLMTLRNGSKVYQPCTVALNEAPSLQDGQINKVKAAFNGNNRLTRYAS